MNTIAQFPPEHGELPPQYRLTPPDNREDAPLAWMADGACVTADPDAFFPEKGGPTKDAKRVCASCDVRAQCLQYALDNGERFGLWGGMSERDRRKLRDRTNQARNGREKPTHGSNGMYNAGCHDENECPRNSDGVTCTAAHRAYQATYTRRKDGAA